MYFTGSSCTDIDQVNDFKYTNCLRVDYETNECIKCEDYNL